MFKKIKNRARFINIFLFLLIISLINPNVGFTAKGDKLDDDIIEEETLESLDDGLTAVDILERYKKATGTLEQSDEYPGFTYGEKDAEEVEQLSAIKFKTTALGKLGGYALDVNSKVWSWGYNISGRLGIGKPASGANGLNYSGGLKRIPYFVDNNIDIIKIGAGYETGYALDDKGNLYAWGHGNQGQMGDGKSSTTNVNPTPQKVNIDTKIIDFYPAKTLQPHHIIAVDENGDMWAWGYAAGNRIPGESGSISTPVKIDIPDLGVDENGEKIKFIKVAPSNAANMALTSDGRVFSWGNGGRGVLGHGNTRNVDTPKEIESLKDIVDIDSNYDRMLANDSLGNVYQWGECYGYRENGGTENVSTPTLVEIDEDEQKLAGYKPKAVKITASERTSYFIDQYGRSWAWGNNMYGGFSRDGGKITGERLRENKAKIWPKIIGDGNTQSNDNNAKFPKYATDINSKIASGRGGYGYNDLNPSAYDEKYMLKNKSGEIIGTNKEVLTYEKATGKYINEKGEIGIPLIDSKESWISLTFKQPGYMVDISSERSSTMYIDSSGNLFKSSYDGSGSIAWGWDFEDEYDQNGSEKTGIYDRYVHELVYMRGAPRIPKGSINFIETENSKIYEVGDYDSVTIDLEFKLPEGIYDDDLNLHEDPEFKKADYIFIPYDMEDKNALKEKYSDKEFEELIKEVKDPDSGLKDKGYKYTELEDLEIENDKVKTQIEEKENGLVLVRTVSEIYGTDSVSINKTLIDNFYTPVNIKHKGIGNAKNYENHGGEDNVLVYGLTDKNVKKMNSDGVSKTTVGFPLDANGKVITSKPVEGVAKKEAPTFGYDKVYLSSYDLDEFKLDGWDLLIDKDGKLAEKPLEFELILDENMEMNILEDGILEDIVENFYYRANSNIISKADIDVINQEDSKKPDERFFAHVRISNKEKKEGVVHVFNKRYVGEKEDKKPLDALDSENLIGVFETDNMGVLNTETNDKFARALQAEYGGLDGTNLIRRIPVSGKGDKTYPLEAVFKEQKIGNINWSGKLLSFVLNEKVLEKEELERTKYTFYGASDSLAILETEQGAEIKVLHKGEIIASATGTGKREVIRFNEKLNSGDLISITVKVSNRLVNIMNYKLK